MCGITGFWGQETPSAATASKMAAQILHRGPDDEGDGVRSRLGWHSPTVACRSWISPRQATNPCIRPAGAM